MGALEAYDGPECVLIWSVTEELIETGQLVIVNVVIGGCEARAQGP